MRPIESNWMPMLGLSPLPHLRPTNARSRLCPGETSR
jgi:hypothetical protein